MDNVYFMQFLCNLHITMLFLLRLERDELEETGIKRIDAEMRSGRFLCPQSPAVPDTPPSRIIELNGK